MKYPSKIFILLYVSLCLVGSCLPTVIDAAPIEYINITSIKDSMEAAEDVNILANRVTVKNSTRKTKRIGIKVSVPKGWKNLSLSKYIDGDEVYYNLQPGQEVDFPINLLRLPNASPIWSPVSINVWNRDVASDSISFVYYIKTYERKNFVAQPRNQDIEIGPNNKSAKPVTYLKNTGNVVDKYILRYRNYHLNIYDTVVLYLQPDQDTVYTHEIEFSNFQLSNISSETILITVNNTETLQKSYSYSVNKYTEKNKVNNTPYAEAPLLLEAGYMTFGDRSVYYGSARGRMTFDSEKSLEYYYRSKQFGNVRTGLQRHIFRVYYKSTKFSIAAGQVSAPMYFILNTNRGVDVGYHTKNMSFRVIGTKYDSFSYYKNNNITALLNYRVGKIGVSNTAIFNDEVDRSIRSYVLLNDVAILSKEKLSLNLKVGTGIDERYGSNFASQPLAKPGLSAGYNFRVKKGLFSFSSNVNYFNKSFPGVRRGSRSQLHDVMMNTSSGSVGVFYSSNYAITNYFRDSLFNSDILSYNISRLGARYNKATQKSMMTLSAGLITQGGAASLNGGLKNSYFFDVMAKYNLKKSWNVTFNTQSAFGKHPVNDDGVVIITSTFDVNSKNGGLNAVFSRFPITGNVDGQQVITGYNETVNGGPYVNMHFFNHRLFGSLRYNISKSLKDDNFISGVGGNLSYNSLRGGLGISVSTFYPFQNQTNDPGLPIANRRTLQASISKQFNVPLIVKRKYYDLKVVLYEDNNNNHKLDPGEKKIRNIKLLINDDPFVSNNKGEVLYKNINNGTYKLKIHNSSKTVVPIDGYDQTVTVYKNTKVEIPFKKSRIIKGKVEIVQDSFSKVDLSPDFIKVIAKGQDGKYYSTLTDINGAFEIPVPAGEYKVSLSEGIIASDKLKIVQPVYNVDLSNAEEKEIVFTIREKVRKIRFLKK